MSTETNPEEMAEHIDASETSVSSDRKPTAKERAIYAYAECCNHTGGASHESWSVSIIYRELRQAEKAARYNEVKQAKIVFEECGPTEAAKYLRKRLEELEISSD